MTEDAMQHALAVVRGELPSWIDNAVSVLIDAADTDAVYWSTLAVGQDTEEAESSGYLCGYRDALCAIQALLHCGNTKTLAGYIESVRAHMREQQEEVEEIDPGYHFWNG